MQNREQAMRRHGTARSNLLTMLLFTLVNIGLLLFDSSTMFLFSATVPYYALMMGIYSEFQPFLIAGIAAAVISVLLYLCCWLCSKRHRGWLTMALILFSLDTLVLVGLYILLQDWSGILDLVFHIILLVCLFQGIRAESWLKKNPEPEDATPEAIQADTPWLRRADTEEKLRILLETESNGRQIVYRRIKRVNELVIDGYVYDEVSMLFETPHTLTAVLDGHTYEVGYNGNSQSFCRVDGAMVERKARIF